MKRLPQLIFAIFFIFTIIESGVAANLIQQATNVKAAVMNLEGTGISEAEVVALTDMKLRVVVTGIR